MGSEKCQSCGGEKITMFGHTCHACAGTGRKLSGAEVATIYRRYLEKRDEVELLKARIAELEEVASFACIDEKGAMKK